MTYEVESKDSGFLSLGKLTARVDKKDSGFSGQGSEISKSQAPRPKPQAPRPSPLFAVRTPTAVVTDLGTEFGVEATKEGRTTAHVFRGSVKLQVAAGSGKNPLPACCTRTIAQVEGRSSGQAGGERVVVLARSAKPASLSANCPSEHQTLDLVDLVAGGDGTRAGATGHRPDQWPSNRHAAQDAEEHNHTCRRWKVSSRRGLAVVDGVFIPDGRRCRPSRFRRSSVRRIPRDATISADYFGRAALPDTWWRPNRRAGRRRLCFVRSNLLYMHANKGITFDLDAIRRANPGCRLLRFRAMAGNTEKSFSKGSWQYCRYMGVGRWRSGFRAGRSTAATAGFRLTVPLAAANASSRWPPPTPATGWLQRIISWRSAAGAGAGPVAEGIALTAKLAAEEGGIGLRRQRVL